MPKIAKVLSATEVERLTHAISASGKPYNALHPVGGVSGLHLQVTPTGAKSWILRTVVGDRRRNIGLGAYPEVSLSKARRKAAETKERAAKQPILHLVNGEDMAAVTDKESAQGYSPNIALGDFDEFKVGDIKVAIKNPSLKDYISVYSFISKCLDRKVINYLSELYVLSGGGVDIKCVDAVIEGDLVAEEVASCARQFFPEFWGSAHRSEIPAEEPGWRRATA